MRVFVAGATGVIGVPILKLLVADGHEVAGMTRTPGKADLVQSLGAVPVVCDVYDADRVRAAVVAFAPDVLMHELTDLPDRLEDLDQYRLRNSRIRREGTQNLLAAADAARCPQFMVQSVAWELPGAGGVAVAVMERSVLDRNGVVLRYGRLYGPGTFGGDVPPPPPRVHVDDAARQTVKAMDQRGVVLNVVE
jgi:NAD dependent epimerase/dehydratase family enzyme